MSVCENILDWAELAIDVASTGTELALNGILLPN